MTPKEYLEKYTVKNKVMQIACVREGKPWICSVHYVADNRLNLYWLSLPSRRHSEELAANPHAAVAVAVKTDQPVIGIQAEGVVEVMTDKDVVREVMELYVARHGSGKDYYDNFIRGTEKHRLYRFVPSRFMLFDEVDFPGGMGQEIVMD